MASNIEAERPIVKSNERPAFYQKEFDHEFSIEKEITNKDVKRSIKRSFTKIAHSFDPRKLLGYLTILNLITEYDFKNWFVADILSGLTVGIMQIPQVN